MQYIFRLEKLKRKLAQISCLLLILPNAIMLPAIQSTVSNSENEFLKVSNINIKVLDVFDSTETFYKYRFAKLANTLHITTKHSIIKRELLFLSDSLLSRRRLTESANNLRDLGIFQWVNFDVDTVGENYGNLTVRVKDFFSSGVRTSLKVEGGKLLYGVGFSEINLAGRGYVVRFDVVKQQLRDFIKLVYINPRFLGSRFINGFTYIKFSDAETYAIGLNKLFFSHETEWDAGINFSKYSGKRYVYRSRQDYSKFEQDLQWFQSSYGYYFGEKTRYRIGFRYLYKDDLWADPTVPGKTNEYRSRRLSVSFGGIRRSISIGRNIDRSVFEEDIHTGLLINGGFGLDLPGLGSRERREVYTGHIQYGVRLSPKDYAFIETSHGRIQQNGQTLERTTNARLSFVSSRIKNQTLTGKVSFSHLDFQQPFAKLFLDETAGLRGYSFRELVGTRRLLINLENRIFSNFRFLTFRIGGALFFDTGKIWRSGEAFGSANWHSSVGFGLRLGVPKITKGILRVDIAYNLDREEFPSISLSNGSYFRVLFPMRMGLQNFIYSITN